MKGFIGELQRRGVLRVAGLYVALTWLVLQAADVVFPALGLPDSALRYILYGAAGLFPLVLLLSWSFELTSAGIRTEEEAREEGAERAGNSALTVATITALVLALAISLFVNFEQATDAPAERQDIVSILVADFINQTGDPLFDGSLESALTIGMEGAPFITSYARHLAEKVAQRISAGSTLNEESARLVSVREGINLVLAGSIEEAGDGYKLSQRVIDPRTGELVAEADVSADDKAGVLMAVGTLAAQIREALGDVSLKGGNLAAEETFTSASLAAVQLYTQAQTHAFQEQNIEAISYFEKAVAEDPEFGRAYVGWALSELKLGHREKSEGLWEKGLSLIDGMSERERYRTLGIYYTTVTANQGKAIETYQLLVEKYPADGIGWNNLGVAYFYTLQFDKALEVGGQLVELFPSNPAFRANYALFAMYAGDFAVARKEAELLLAENPTYFLAYLPLAMAEIVDGDLLAAESVYLRMGENGRRAQSMSITGLADIALLSGNYSKAAQLLQSGKESDTENGNSRGAANKGVYLAKAQAALGDRAGALANLQQSLNDNQAINDLLPAALLYIELGEMERAGAIQQQLGEKLQQGHRAAASLIEGAIAAAEEDTTAAVAALNSSLQRADSWQTHYFLGRALADGGDPAQALLEFDLCLQRIGESTALFLDDIPTFQYSAPLYYWLGRTRHELGMESEAREMLEKYLSLRDASDQSVWTVDARSRLATLSP
jgi:tetratricopeptide (TPR) repeat protein